MENTSARSAKRSLLPACHVALKRLSEAAEELDAHRIAEFL